MTHCYPFKRHNACLQFFPVYITAPLYNNYKFVLIYNGLSGSEEA